MKDIQKLTLYSDEELAELETMERMLKFKSRFLNEGEFPLLHRRKAVLGEGLEISGAWKGAWAKAQLYLEASESAILAFLGARGTGKTQLATCLAYEVMAEKARKGLAGRAVYRRVAEFFMELKEVYGEGKGARGGSELDVLSSFTRPDLLVLDEMQVRNATEWEDTMLALLIDKRYCRGVRTILISNLKPKDFSESMGDSIMDRIAECGAIIRCDWQSFRSRSRRAGA